jgi:hypothetical protein
MLRLRWLGGLWNGLKGCGQNFCSHGLLHKIKALLNFFEALEVIHLIEVIKHIIPFQQLRQRLYLV